MLVIVLLICLSVSVNCDDSDEGKYIDLLPESEKRDFLERVARRILEEVETKQVAKQPSVTLSDSKLDDTSSYVSKLLKEEAADLKRRSFDHNKTNDNVNNSLRGGDKDRDKYIDLTLRDGPPLPDVDEDHHNKETTMSVISTGERMGIESTLDTHEKAVNVWPEKKSVHVIKTNDLPSVGSDNVTEMLNMAAAPQVAMTSSSQMKTKRSFRTDDEKIDVQITIDDDDDKVRRESQKKEAIEKPPHIVFEDNLKKENSIQDDTKSPKMRTRTDAPSSEKKVSIIVYKKNKSVNTPNIRNENYIQDNENQTIAIKQKLLRNDKDIMESPTNDELRGNSRRSAVDVLKNEKEVNNIPEDDAEAATPEVFVTTTEITRASITSTPALQETTLSTDVLKANVTNINALDTTTVSTVTSTKNKTSNKTTDIYFRSDDIKWPQSVKDSPVTVFDTNNEVNNTTEGTVTAKTEVTVTATTEGGMKESTTQTIPQTIKSDTRLNVDKDHPIHTRRQNSNVSLNFNDDTLHVTQSDAKGPLSTVTVELNTTTEKVDDVKRNVVETPTSQSESNNEAQTMSTKVLISENESPVVRAQEDKTETETLAPLKGVTDTANVLTSSDNNQETNTKVKLTTQMNTQTGSTTTKSSIDADDNKRRKRKYEAIDSEKLIETTSITESMSEITSKPVVNLVNEPVNVTASIDSVNQSVYEPQTQHASKPDSIAATKSATQAFSALISQKNNQARVGNGMLGSESVMESVMETTSTSAINQIYEATVAASIIRSAQANDLKSKVATELATEIFRSSVSEPSNEVISESTGTQVSKLSSELMKLPTVEPITKTNNEQSSEAPNDLANDLALQRGSESASESVSIEPTSRSNTRLEVESSAINKDKINKLKEEILQTLSPISLTNNHNNEQIEKPDDKPNNLLENVYIATEKTKEDTTTVGIKTTTTATPVTTMVNGDIEVKTNKYETESTSRNFDSSEIMTRVPKLAAVPINNVPKSNKTKHIMKKKLSLQLGLVPDEPVTERQYESLIKFHSSRVLKAFSVYEVEADKERYQNFNNLALKNPTPRSAPRISDNNKKDSYLVPVYDYAPKNAYYNPQTRMKPERGDDIVNIARNNEQQSNIERIPIYDYSPKNAYYNPHNRLGPNFGGEFLVRSNSDNINNKHEPDEISQAELQRILREDDDEISKPETAKIDSATRGKYDNRNEPVEISEAELKDIFRENDVPSASELQDIINETGATREEVIAALRKDTELKDVLRSVDNESFVFPPDAKSEPLEITELDVQEILRDSDRTQKQIRKSNYQKHLKPQNLKFIFEKLSYDNERQLSNILKARANDGVLNVFEISKPKNTDTTQRKSMGDLQEAQIQSISNDYYDIDDFGRRRKHKNARQKTTTTQRRGKPKDEEEEDDFHFPNSDEAEHPYHKLKKKRFGSLTRIVKNSMVQAKHYKNVETFVGNHDPLLKHIKNRVKTEETSTSRTDKHDKNKNKDKQDNHDKSDEKKGNDNNSEKKRDDDDKSTKKKGDDLKSEEKKDDNNKDDDEKDDHKKDDAKKDEDQPTGGDKKDDAKKDDDKKDEEKKDNDKQDEEKKEDEPTSGDKKDDANKDEEKKDEEKKDDDKKDEKKKEDEPTNGDKKDDAIKDEEKKDEEKKDEEKKNEEKKDEEKKDEQKKVDDQKDDAKKDDKKDDDKEEKKDLRTYLKQMQNKLKSLNKYTKLEELQTVLDGNESDDVFSDSETIKTFANYKQRKTDTYRGKVDDTDETIKNIFYNNKAYNVKEMNRAMDFSDNVNVNDAGTHSREENVDVEPYITVMRDMILDNDSALVNYNWLTTTVEIRSALKKMFDLVESYTKHQILNPYDLQLMKYLMFLYQTTLKRSNKYQFTRQRVGSRAPFKMLSLGQRGLLPKSFRKEKRHFVKNFLSLQTKRDMYWYDISAIREENNDFLNFLLSLDDGLRMFHDAIKHIALITKYNNQRWFANLRELYLYDPSRKRVIQVILHMFTTRLIQLIDDSATDTNFISSLKYKLKNVKATIREFKIILQLLDELKQA